MARLLGCDLQPLDAVVGKLLEWVCNLSQGLEHPRSCNEESMYFKINAIQNPEKLVRLRQSSRHDQIISQADAPR